MAQNEGAIRRFEDELASPRTILRAGVLLMLEERPSYGYDIVTRLEPFGYDRRKPGPVYRSLWWLEKAGFVEQRWETTGIGPARRVYELSPSGRCALEIAAAALRRQAKVLDDKLSRYILRRLRALSKDKAVFDFVVETRVSVDAPDATRARRKVERVFGRPQVLDTDVRITGALSIRSGAMPPGAEDTNPALSAEDQY